MAPSTARGQANFVICKLKFLITNGAGIAAYIMFLLDSDALNSPITKKEFMLEILKQYVFGKNGKKDQI